MFCKNCGKPVDGRFCTWCGSPVNEEAQPPFQPAYQTLEQTAAPRPTIGPDRSGQQLPQTYPPNPAAPLNPSQPYYPDQQPGTGQAFPPDQRYDAGQAFPPPYQQPTIIINNANTNTNVNNQQAPSQGAMPHAKNKWVAFLLCFFLGFWGVHKFYEGKILMGLLYIFTGGIFGIGWLIDLIVLLTKPNPYFP